MSDITYFVHNMLPIALMTVEHGHVQFINMVKNWVIQVGCYRCSISKSWKSPLDFRELLLQQYLYRTGANSENG